MRFLKGVVFGVAGGAIGAAAWGGVTYFTNHEIGWIAVLVGVLTGYGVGVGVSPRRTKGSGALAAMIALAAVLGGKLFATQLVVNKLMTDAGAEEMTDETAQRVLAERVAEKFDAEHTPMTLPPGELIEEAMAKGHVPPEVKAEAHRQWTTLTGAEREQLKLDLHREVAERLKAGGPIALIIGFVGSFSPFDLLWLGLASTAAYRIAARKDHSEPEEADAPLIQAPSNTHPFFRNMGADATADTGAPAQAPRVNPDANKNTKAA